MQSRFDQVGVIAAMLAACTALGFGCSEDEAPQKAARGGASGGAGKGGGGSGGNSMSSGGANAGGTGGVNSGGTGGAPPGRAGAGGAAGSVAGSGGSDAGAAGETGDAGTPGAAGDSSHSCFDEQAEVTAIASNTFGTDPRLGAPHSVTAPNFAPVSTLSGGAMPPEVSFFDSTATYFGAIGASDWTSAWTAYPTDQTPADNGTVLHITGSPGGITAHTIWSGTVYLDAGTKLYVMNGATLTIEPGTIIKGSPGSALIVTKNGRIEAAATAAAPIIMTSDQPSGSAAAGDWGGLVLLGDAAINLESHQGIIEGFAAIDPNNRYGPGVAAADDAHDCGTLRYVRIEYAGGEIAPGFPMPAFATAGCGLGTEIDRVQVHRSSNDGIGVFGGTADLKHVVISSPGDDGIDWDYGWTGRVQFMVVQHALDKAMECDSNSNMNDATPRSHPLIWNATFIGDANSTGIHFRHGTAGEVHNSISMGFPDYALNVAGWPTALQWHAGNLLVSSTIFFQDGPGTSYPGWAPGFDLAGDPAVQDDCPP